LTKDQHKGDSREFLTQEIQSLSSKKVCVPRVKSCTHYRHEDMTCCTSLDPLI
jgi:hypothetical protein